MESEKKTFALDADLPEPNAPSWEMTTGAMSATPAAPAGTVPHYKVKDNAVFGEHPTKGRVPVLSLETGEVKKDGGFRMTPNGPEQVDTAVKKDFYCGDVIDIPVSTEKITFLKMIGLIEEVK